jgi:RNase P subunit RPR2
MICQHCDALYINGLKCHERGCPAAPVECRECGSVHDSGLESHRDARMCCDETESDND